MELHNLKIQADSKREGYRVGLSEIPCTSAPRALRQIVNQEPLKPVCPVTKIFLLFQKSI